VSHLVQLLLPLCDNSGQAFPPETHAAVSHALVERFGGVTAYSRAPAEGVWEEGRSRMRDEVIVVEVMVDELDRGWWRSFREGLERAFRQEELVVRALPIQRL
jgi:hypothetical protein